MENNKGAIGAKGPILNQNNSVNIELPDCVKIVTEQDSKDFEAFMSSVIRAAQAAVGKTK